LRDAGRFRPAFRFGDLRRERFDKLHCDAPIAGANVIVRQAYSICLNGVVIGRCGLGINACGAAVGLAGRGWGKGKA
jgi:hypothetical protein